MKNLFSLAKGSLGKNKGSKGSKANGSQSTSPNSSRDSDRNPENSNSLDEEEPSWASSSIEGIEFEGLPNVDDDIMSEFSMFEDEEINFDMVYALCDFNATVDGQISVVAGEAVFLKDDTNAYWWLIEKPDTGEIGYVPAEALESADSKLARLNSYRNQKLCLPSALSKDIEGNNNRKTSKPNPGVAFSFPVVSSIGETYTYTPSDSDEEEFDSQAEYSDESDSDFDEEAADDSDIDGSEIDDSFEGDRAGVEEDLAENREIESLRDQDELEILIGMRVRNAHFASKPGKQMNPNHAQTMSLKIRTFTTFYQVLEQALKASSISNPSLKDYFILVEFRNFAFSIELEGTILNVQQFLKITRKDMLRYMENELTFIISRQSSRLSRRASKADSMVLAFETGAGATPLSSERNDIFVDINDLVDAKSVVDLLDEEQQFQQNEDAKAPQSEDDEVAFSIGKFDFEPKSLLPHIQHEHSESSSNRGFGEKQEGLSPKQRTISQESPEIRPRQQPLLLSPDSQVDDNQVNLASSTDTLVLSQQSIPLQPRQLTQLAQGQDHSPSLETISSETTTASPPAPSNMAHLSHTNSFKAYDDNPVSPRSPSTIKSSQNSYSNAKTPKQDSREARVIQALSEALFRNFDALSTSLDNSMFLTRAAAPNYSTVSRLIHYSTHSPMQPVRSYSPDPMNVFTSSDLIDKLSRAREVNASAQEFFSSYQIAPDGKTTFYPGRISRVRSLAVAPEVDQGVLMPERFGQFLKKSENVHHRLNKIENSLDNLLTQLSN